MEARECRDLIAEYPARSNSFTEVDRGEWRLSQRTGGDLPLATLAVSSCTVVAINSPDTGRGYLGHFFHPHLNCGGNREQFDLMVETIIATEDPAHPLEAWVSGNSLFGDDRTEAHKIHDEVMHADRSYVLHSLAKIVGQDSIKIKWLGNKEVLPVVTFDPMGETAILCAKEPNPNHPDEIRMLEELSRDGLLDQFQSAAPQDLYVPSRLKED